MRQDLPRVSNGWMLVDASPAILEVTVSLQELEDREGAGFLKLEAIVA